MVQPIEIDPATTALVLVDLQNVTMAMPTVPHVPEKILANSVKLAERCRARGVLVVLVKVSVGIGGAVQLRTNVDMPFPAFKVPDRWDEIPSALGPQPADVIVTKYNWGGFYSTDMDLQLRRRGIRMLIIGGIATNFGVESTARQAQEAGYQPLLVEDAMGAFSIEDHQFVIGRIFPRLGWVRSTDEVLAVLG